MPQTCHHPRAITLGLLQPTAIRTTRFQHKNTTKSPKQCSKISTGKNAKNSSTESTKQLHWLPIKQCIDYKVLTLVHKCQHQKASNYLQDLITEKSVRRPGLRSENLMQQLEVPHTKMKPLPAKVSVYVCQPNGISCPTPLGMNPTMTNSKHCLKLISSAKLITNSSNVKCLS